jgi:iron uptake system EfeUOB component EfeO/EfeM
VRKITFLLGTLLLAIAFLIANSNPEAKNAKINQDANSKVNDETSLKEDRHSALINGLDKVLYSVEELKNTVNEEPNNTRKINEMGLNLEANWDVIEKEVEELDKESYVNIEKSLYPLIAEAKNNKPNVNNIKKLITETTEKLNNFKETLS